MILISYFLKHNYDVWFENEELSDKEILTGKEESTALPPMPALEGDQAKEGKGLKILTPNKLLTRVPILLTQIKAGNNSYIFCIRVIKSPKTFTTIESNHYNNGRKYDCDKRSQNVLF